MSWGRVFQIFGAIQLKALLPMVVKCTDGTTRVTEAEDLRDRVGEYTWKSSLRYEGARLWRAL